MNLTLNVDETLHIPSGSVSSPFDIKKTLIKKVIDKNKIAINEEHLNNVFDSDNHNHRVSTGLNVIVDKRGTGKTEFKKKLNHNIMKKTYMISLNLKPLNPKSISNNQDN